MEKNLLENELLSHHTTFKIGGPATKFVSPSTVEELISEIKFCRENKEKFFVLGGGSNLVFSDAGFSGTIICTKNLNKIDCNELQVKCQAGVTISAFTTFCKNQELSGFETFAGLPGTIGGALFMNARCFEVEVADVLESATYLNLQSLQVENYRFNTQDWSYKKSPFNKGDCIVLSATFRAACTKPASEIEEKNRFYINERKSKGHFEFPSAGSVFKNNHEFGKPSGKIIDEAGLRGFSIGGAKVADFHGNFIINTGNATASDVKALVEKVKSVVLEKYGFALEEEIIFVD